MMEKQSKPLNTKKIENILIRSTNWIGDAIMTTPAVRAVRKNFPDARISILAKPWVAPVFEDSPHVDETIAYDNSGKLGVMYMAKRLENRRFDVAILLQNAFEAALVAYLSKIQVRVGYDRDARRLLLTHPVPCTRRVRSLHQTHYYNEILRGVGLVPDGPRLELYFSSEDRKAAGEILRRSNISASERIVGINPSATFGPAKQWFPERFAEVSDRLHREFSTRTLIFGGPKDKELGRRVRKTMKSEAVDLSGRTTLKQAIALIAKCDLFITNDSGLMHVAAALNTPQIAIFGSTDHVATGPASSRSRIVRSSAPCSPCLRRHCPLGHMDCMRQIRTGKVLRVARRILR